ncbi:hypothetical protein CBL_10682 [Carabus blaptoides fortunei]
MAGLLLALPACAFFVCGLIFVYKYIKSSPKPTEIVIEDDDRYAAYTEQILFEEMSGDTNDALEEEIADANYSAGPSGDHNNRRSIAANLARFARSREGFGETTISYY